METCIQNIYTSCSCNLNPNVITWGDNGLIYYGSCNAIAVYDPQAAQRVLHTCCGHNEEVRSVRWVHNYDNPSSSLLLSTSSDATTVVWKLNDETGLEMQATLKEHSGAVTISDGLQLNTQDGKTDIFVVTSSIDCSVKIWRNSGDSDDFICVQTLKASSGFCLDVRLHTLPNTNIPLLACAMDDFKIGLYTWEDGSFQKKEVLAGHEDWVCCLAWTTLEDGDVMLASGSQDTYIRLWRVSSGDNVEPQRSVSQLAANEEIKPEQKVFFAHGKGFRLKLDSVLLAHNAWVHSVAWHPRIQDKSTTEFKQPAQLLSSSMDATVCVWEPDSNSGVWSPSARLGLLKEDSLGIQGCIWGPPDTCSVLAHTIQGSMHRWNKMGQSWESGFTVGGGHFGEVLDLSWEPGGAFLFSVSTDQTTRIHAPWPTPGQQSKEVWHELSRPQVHGYDLTCIAPISRYRFASGAEEKIIRCFQASKQFKLCLKQICKVDVPKSELEGVQAASLPVLGLSNLSVSDVEQAAGALLLHGLENVSEPLREEVLWRGTLWPEERKLYGHGYELYCLAASHSGHFLASASRAALPDHAAIILWDTRSWQEIQKLPSHQLTVTQMAFSPDDQYLLSVSRDRRLSLFGKVEGEGGSTQFSLLFSTDKRTGVHTRIIWSCSWTSDSLYFATGSREGTVVVWGRNADGSCSPASPPLTLPQSVTALAFAPITMPYLLAVGTDEGTVALYQWQPLQDDSWKLLVQLDKHIAHHKTVKRLSFRPCQGDVLQLATGASDHAVKIFNITVPR